MNVLVHCIAGRSRSASVLAAWMLVSEPKLQSAQDVVNQIRIIRPWIEINAHFMHDLDLFRAVLGSTNRATLSAEMAVLLTDRSFPRLDFGANLVDGIVKGTKTITMRHLSVLCGYSNDSEYIKTSFDSIDEVLAVLTQYYPNVATATSLLMLHFHYLCPVAAK
ncbi:unnamed protein product [Peronospora destructor]|uniref:Tyrosine specific protein phosphatases domain-containing protein n=1 Tax=Peronospora destructor TaxID=86335 RepID=A0AAV0URA3_9STRA|nr:unnamed protein product [Peronospora destructor]CAI5738823.1 unnamed protein product [Peronospora destructor]